MGAADGGKLSERTECDSASAARPSGEERVALVAGAACAGEAASGLRRAAARLASRTWSRDDDEDDAEGAGTGATAARTRLGKRRRILRASRASLAVVVGEVAKVEVRDGQEVNSRDLRFKQPGVLESLEVTLMMHRKVPGTAVQRKLPESMGLLPPVCSLRTQAANAQLAHLLQCALDLGVECSGRVVVPHALGKVALYAAELVVAVRREVGLQPDLYDEKQ